MGRSLVSSLKVIRDFHKQEVSSPVIIYFCVASYLKSMAGEKTNIEITQENCILLPHLSGLLKLGSQLWQQGIAG